MRIKCYSCHMSIPLDREFIIDALDYVEEEDLSHYDVRCPKCRTTNRVSKKQLLRAMPRGKREQ